jgi:hypothetical protein
VEGGISDPRQISQKNNRWIRTSDNTGTQFGAKLRDVVQMLPTPTATASQGARSTDAFHQRGKSSHISPLFVEEMMGFPENWITSPFLSGEKNQSKPTETP